MIELKNITLKYNDTIILNNLNLVCKSQQLTCLLGSSGCGKTSILRLIAGLEQAESGIIKIDNEIVSKNSKRIVPINERGIGFIFQDLALWPHLTVYENIAFGLKQKQVENSDTEVMKMLNYFDIAQYADKYPQQLSGGQKQLLAIARSLVLKPKILLMDEPLSNLDVKLKHKILAYIKQLKKHFEMTIIYVTHDHKEAFAIADTIVVINQGKIEIQDSVANIKKSNNAFINYFLEY